MSASDVNFRKDFDFTNRVEKEDRLKGKGKERDKKTSTTGKKTFEKIPEKEKGSKKIKGDRFKRQTSGEIKTALNKILSRKNSPMEQFAEIKSKIPAMSKDEAFFSIAENYLKNMKEVKPLQEFDAISNALPEMPYERRLCVLINDMMGALEGEYSGKVTEFADNFLNETPPQITELTELLVGAKTSTSEPDFEGGLAVLKSWALSRAAQASNVKEAIKIITKTIDDVEKDKLNGKDKKTQQLRHEICDYYQKQFFKKLSDLGKPGAQARNEQDKALQEALEEASKKLHLKDDKLVLKLEKNFKKSVKTNVKKSVKRVRKTFGKKFKAISPREQEAIEHVNQVLIGLAPHRVRTGMIF